MSRHSASRHSASTHSASTHSARTQPASTHSADTLVDLLDRAGALAGSGLRFLDRKERPTFWEWSRLRTEARRMAAALLELGIEPGDRIALVFPTGADFFHAFFGAQVIGAVPVPLYPPVRLGRLDEYHRRTASMIDAASARLLLTDSRVHRLLGPTVELAARNGHLDLGCRQIAALTGARSTTRMLEVPGAPRPAADDLALVQFSSGTTVDPKPVALSHRAVLAQVAALNAFWPDDPSSGLHHTGVSWLPLYHDMGLIGCVFPALERPSTLTLFGPEVFVRRPATWLRAISTHRATISVAPNFAYGLCVEKIRDEELEGVDLGAWQVALNGAEAVSGDVLRAFQARFARWGFRPEALTPVYGLSEATLGVTFSRLDRPFSSHRFDREKLSEGRAVLDDGGREMISVGRPLPGTEIRIAPRPCPADTIPAGTGPVSLAEGQVGRVLVRGPSVMEGYLDRPELTARALHAGWLDTGDLGFVHEGELYLAGRAKDVVILRGRNYSPSEIEQAVDTVPGVRTGCVVAVSRAVDGLEPERSAPGDPSAAGDRALGGQRATERLWLFVEHRGDLRAGDEEGLSKACGEAVLTACGIRPDHVVLLGPGTLPRTSSGKLRRSAALDQYLDGSLHAPAQVNPWRMAGAVLQSTLAHARASRRQTES